MQTKLTPIQHSTLEDHHRVAVAIVDNMYEVYVSDNTVRIYDEETLPRAIKIALTMIRAGQKKPPDFVWPTGVLLEAYEFDSRDPFFEIGWYVTPALFIVVLPTKDLTYMRGEAYNLMYGKFRRSSRDGSSIAPTYPTYPHLEAFLWYKYSDT